MLATIYRFLWRRHRMTVILCALAPIAIGIIIGFVYPTYAKERQLLKIFKISGRFFGADQMDLFSPEGAFTMPFQHPFVLVLYALVTGAAAVGVPAGERGRGGLDLLLATPLERGTLMRAVTAFMATAAAIIGLSAFLGGCAGAVVAGELSALPLALYLRIAASAAFLSLCLGSIGLLMSVVAADRGQATIWYGTGVFIALSLDVAARLWRGGAWLGKLSPYGWFRPADLLSAETLGPWAMQSAVLLGASAAAMIGSIVVERRRKSA